MSEQLVLLVHSIFPDDINNEDVGESIELVGVFETKGQVKQAIFDHQYAKDDSLVLNWEAFNEHMQVMVEDAEDLGSENKLGFIVKTSK